MTERASKKGIWSWMLFDWAGQPFHTLVITFIFAPYFANTLFDDKAAGQSAWGFLVAIAGILVAFSAPVVSSIAEKTGPRKPWLFAFGALFSAGAYGLWWAAPGMESYTIVYISFIAAFVGAEYIIVFANAMLPDLVPAEDVGRLSGYGWALGYLGGLITLVLYLLLISTAPGEETTLAGMAPIFGLDTALGEPARASGPISALWFIVFAIPLFLFTPDRRKGTSKAEAVEETTSGLKESLSLIGKKAELWMFFLSSLLYRDGLAVLYSFGAIYSAGVLDWGAFELGVFGIAAITAGIFGAWFGGWMDGRKGPMPVVLFSIFVLLLVSIVVLTITKESVLMIPVEAGSNWPNIAFFLCGAGIGAAGGSMQASSRTLVVEFMRGKLSMNQAFGVYAMAGKSTAFIGPLLVASVTAATGSPRAGISLIVLMFLPALVLLLTANKRAKASA